MWNRVLKALAAIFAGQLLVALANILLVPLYLAHWSAGVYGEWLALFSLVSYLTTLDLGVSVAVANSLTQGYARGALTEYRQFFHSALAFYLAMAAAGILLLFVGARALPLPRWLGLRQLAADDAFWVLLLLGVQVLFAMPVGLLSSVYRSVGDVARMTWIWNAERGMSFGLVAVGLVLGAGVRAVALLQLLPLFGLGAYCWWDTSRRFPQIRPGISEARFEILPALVRPGLLFMLIILAQALAQQGSIILVSSLLGGAAVAVFATARTLTNTTRMLVNALSGACWPDITGLATSGEHARLRSLHRALVAASTILCVAVAAPLWYEGADVIRVWTRGRLQPDAILLKCLLAQMVLQSPWLASSFFAVATNRHARLSRSYLASSVIGLAIAVPLIGRLGLWGVGLALIAGEALACYHFVIRDTCRMIGEPYGRFALKTWVSVAVVAAAAMLAGRAATMISRGPHLLQWVQVGLTSSTAACLAGWFFWLDREVKAGLLERARRLLHAAGCSWAARKARAASL